MKKIIVFTTLIIFIILPNQILTAQNKKKKRIKTVREFYQTFKKAFDKNDDEKMKELVKDHKEQAVGRVYWLLPWYNKFTISKDTRKQRSAKFYLKRG